MTKQIFTNRVLQLTIVALATVLAFSNIFQNQFLIDDHAFIVNWEKVRTLESIPDLLKGETPQVHQGVYRPFRSVLYAVYYQLFGTNPFGWHLHSLVVHLAATVLVYFIVLELGRLGGLGRLGTYLPLLTSLLFGLHPIHTESITYIAASMEMTGVVFFFAAFLFYLKSEGRKAKGEKLLSLLFALLAFFTYEMTLTLPLLIVLYEFTFRKLRVLREPARQKHQTVRHSDSLTFRRSEFFRVFRTVAPYFLTAFFYLFVRFVLLGIGAARGNYLAYSFYHTQLTMAKVYAKYLQLLVTPYNVSYLHELAPGFYSWMTYYDKLESILAQSITDLDVLFSLAILAMLAIVAIVSFQRRPLITFCVSWFFLSLLPVLYLFPQGIALAEKYLYIASFGYVLLLAAVAQSARGRVWLFAFSLSLLALSYGYFTFQRNKDWHDPITFWGKAAVQQPKSPLAHYNLALSYADKGDTPKAEEEYQKAIAIEPRFWEARFNLGNIYLRKGDYKRSEKEYQAVLQLNPDFAPAEKKLEVIQKTQ